MSIETIEGVAVEPVNVEPVATSPVKKKRKTETPTVAETPPVATPPAPETPPVATPPAHTKRRSKKAAEAPPAAKPAEEKPARGCKTDFCREWRATFASIARSCGEAVRAKYLPGQRLIPYIACIGERARAASQELRKRHGMPPPKPRKRKKSPVPLEVSIKLRAEAARECKGRPRAEFYMCLRDAYQKKKESYLAQHAAPTPAPPVPAPAQHVGEEHAAPKRRKRKVVV